MMLVQLVRQRETNISWAQDRSSGEGCQSYRLVKAISWYIERSAKLQLRFGVQGV